VNYPDPPVWEGSKQRLIDHSFLVDVHRVLRNSGSITIVTDDYSYCSIVIKEFEQLIDIFKSEFGDTKFLDNIPEDYGTSYFDRLWNNGKRTKRYFLKYNVIK